MALLQGAATGRYLAGSKLASKFPAAPLPVRALPY